MSNPPVIKYPLDLTGTALGNQITGELHSVSVGSQPAFVLNYGPFYTAGLILTRMDTGQVLIPTKIGVTTGQYVATQILIDMTLRTGQDICSVIVLTDVTLPANLQVSVTYQVLGGAYSGSVDAIQQLINALDLGNQPVTWGGILGKPVLFPPAPHLHDLGDVYGFEYMVSALERIVQAIYVGDDAQLTAIYAYIDHQIAGLQNNNVGTELTAHLADYTNPHRVTAAQLNLGSVANYPIAAIADAQAGTSNVMYMTPALTAAAITSQIGNAFNAHVANTSNPHNTTAAQVGLGNVQNLPLATVAQAVAATSNSLYVTPYLVSQMLGGSTSIASDLQAHIANLSNPHQVTAAQVGLGSVANYAPATNADAQAGTSTALYMSPAATAAAITSQIGNAFNAHVANYSNPHNTTAAQVGLGNVANYPIGTVTDATTGTSNSVYMTPYLVSQMLGGSTSIASDLQAHISNVSNPHQVTQAQVGLGNVNNTSDLAKPISTATQNALNAKANLASPSLTGGPTAPTAAAGTNTTQLATTAFVQAAIAAALGNYLPKNNPTFTGTMTGPAFNEA